MKRTWIKIKRGILEPKHRFALGEAWQLYFYILNIVNWETGTYEGWKDKDIAVDLDMPLPTLRYQRKRLEDNKYITVEKGQHSQRIIVHRWTNPREYSGEVYNIQSDNQSNNESNNQSNNQSVLPQAQNDSSFIESHYTHHTTHNKESIAENHGDPTYDPCDDDGLPIKPKLAKVAKTDPRISHVAYKLFHKVTGRRPSREMIDRIIEVFGESPDEKRAGECRVEWVSRGYNPQSYKWLDWYQRGIPEKGRVVVDGYQDRQGYKEWETV